jgi:hypothetical protein
MEDKIKLKHNLIKNKKAISSAFAAIVIVAVLVMSVFAYVYMFGVPNFGGSTTTPPANTVVTNQAEPLQFTLLNPVAGGAIASATLTLYDGTTNAALETLTTASNGIIASSGVYTPGQSLYVTIAKSTYVTRTVAFTVPTTATYGQYNAPVYPVSLGTIVNGTWGVTATVSGSTTVYTTGQVINFTTLGVNSLTVTLTVTNTGAANTGWWSSMDAYNHVNQNVGLVAATTGSYVSVSGIGAPVIRGSSTSYYSVLADGYPYTQGLTNQAGLTKVSGPLGTTLVSGQVTVSMTINKGSMTAGLSETFTCTLYNYFDGSYFAANGMGGPNAASAGTFSLVVGA